MLRMDKLYHPLSAQQAVLPKSQMPITSDNIQLLEPTKRIASFCE
jgi:hypothetical protein